MLDRGYWQAGTVVTVEVADGSQSRAVICELPMEAS
jgi:hypothetical protein